MRGQRNDERPDDSLNPVSSTEAAYRRYRIPLFNYFPRCGVPSPAAEDLTQRVFVVMMESRGRFDPERGSVPHYLFGIARNLRRSFRRDHGRELLLVEEGEGPLDFRFRHEEEAISVRRAVGALPDDQREAVILREFHGLDYEAIARLQDIAVGTVRSRLSRAREALREMLR